MFSFSKNNASKYNLHFKFDEEVTSSKVNTINVHGSYYYRFVLSNKKDNVKYNHPVIYMRKYFLHNKPIELGTQLDNVAVASDNHDTTVFNLDSLIKYSDGVTMNKDNNLSIHFELPVKNSDEKYEGYLFILASKELKKTKFEKAIVKSLMNYII